MKFKFIELSSLKLIGIRNIIVVLSVGFTGLIGNVPAHAEGDHPWGSPAAWSGAYGINRVVRTPATGYVEAEGNFDISATLPSRIGPNNAGIMAHNNRPNPYFGGRVGTAEFDAGLIWEPEQAFVNNVTYDPGWSAFIFGGGVPNTNPKIWKNGKSQPWRLVAPAPQNTSQPYQVEVQSFLNFSFEKDGRISLRADVIPYGNGQFFHNGIKIVSASATDPIAPTMAQSKPITTVARLGAAELKRVIALTRSRGPNDLTGYHDELDGTSMKGTFSGGKVRKANGKLGPSSLGFSDS